VAEAAVTAHEPEAPVLDVGAGVRAAVAAGGHGTVIATFRRAAYVGLDDAVLAVTTPAAPPGPLHLRCRLPPTLRTGEPVRADGRCLRGRHWALPGDGPGWEPSLPDPALLRRGWTALPDIGASDPAATAAAREVAAEVAADDLTAAAARLGGRGPGLTPAGDDLLAGLLVVARVRGGAEAEPRLRAVADAVTTTPIARAFLAWAARGQSIAPVHDLLEAIARGDRRAAERALDRLQSVGASSGAFLAAGLALGVLGRPVGDGAAAGPSSG
jgi:hypothetical protein